MRSLKNDWSACVDLIVGAFTVPSSSLSEFDEDDEREDDRKELSELSESGDDNRGVARTVFGDAVISTGGSI